MSLDGHRRSSLVAVTYLKSPFMRCLAFATGPMSAVARAEWAERFLGLGGIGHPRHQRAAIALDCPRSHFLGYSPS